MKKIELILPNGTPLSVSAGSVGSEIAKKIGPRLAKDAIALKINNQEIIDLMTPIEEGCHIKVLTAKDPDALNVLRHSTAHIMSEAVQSLFKGVKVTIGPATATGFYYDYDTPKGFTPDDLKKIEKKMVEIIQTKKPFKRSVVTKKAAIQKFKKMGEDYKVEIIKGIEEPNVSIYQQGQWEDLCRGPHIPHSGWVKAFKLLSLAGAYWRGDEKNKMLQRIYGTAFFSKKDLDAFLQLREEAKKRDHRKLAKTLDLFSFHSVAPAHPFFHRKGQLLYELLVDYWKDEHKKLDYEFVKTPLIMSSELWHRSGHYENFKENMYFVNIDEREFAVKPMNCPGHILIYKTKKHSYRDLPIRMTEIGQVHRHERAGVTHGLFRTRTFSIDDAHIFCRSDQAGQEIIGVIDLVLSMYKTFGFKEYKIELSTRPEKSIGTDKMWEQATAELSNALKKCKLEFKVNEGDGAFYGPKIDFHVKDVLGRTWQCGTIQLDFSMPERFKLAYTEKDGKNAQPVMIHRAVFGSVERFLGILIEHYGGSFPVWLAPVQAIILNVTDKQKKYATLAYQQLRQAGFRIELDVRNEKLGFKIREAQIQKIPYMIVIGDREVESKTISPRMRSGKQLAPLSVDQFIEHVNQDINKRR